MGQGSCGGGAETAVGVGQRQLRGWGRGAVGWGRESCGVGQRELWGGRESCGGG